ncbi:hypothetical protein [Thaumasiovibrio subtropicus]|uniref:hypothetical protein n=1 Tax=Thaumasiovibrio subtropicus TaxID=1891207 RepID=UPI000B34ABC2|nr:hypothetical protein [Thaumasiovibrio subtropicus]
MQLDNRLGRKLISAVLLVGICGCSAPTVEVTSIKYTNESMFRGGEFIDNRWCMERSLQDKRDIPAVELGLLVDRVIFDRALEEIGYHAECNQIMFADVYCKDKQGEFVYLSELTPSLSPIFLVKKKGVLRDSSDDILITLNMMLLPAKSINSDSYEEQLNDVRKQIFEETQGRTKQCGLSYGSRIFARRTSRVFEIDFQKIIDVIPIAP